MQADQNKISVATSWLRHILGLIRRVKIQTAAVCQIATKGNITGKGTEMKA